VSALPIFFREQIGLVFSERVKNGNTENLVHAEGVPALWTRRLGHILLMRNVPIPDSELGHEALCRNRGRPGHSFFVACKSS